MTRVLQSFRLASESVHSAVTSRWPIVSRTYWRERRQACPDRDREPNIIFQSADCRRLRVQMARRRNSDLQHWAAQDAASTPALPPITICIVTHNSALDLALFEPALMALDYPHQRISLIFIDNGSSDTTPAWLDDFAKRRRAIFNDIQIHCQGNVGFARAQNRAIEAVATEFVLVCNPDAKLNSDSLAVAVSHAQRDPQDVAAWEFSQRPFEHPKYYDPVTLETGWNSHACILLRRAAIMAVGGYEPALFLYGEDTEISYRLRAAGYRLRYLPKAKISHNAFTKSGRRDEQAFRSLAANYLLRRRYGRWSDRMSGWLLFRLARRGAAQDMIGSAKQLINKHRSEFKPVSRGQSAFPFNGVYYDHRRLGTAFAMPDGENQNGEHALVTIITRSHKPGPILEQAIMSVKHQTYPHIEHIVIEDGYEGPRREDSVKYISTPGLGRSKAGNIGASAAKGEWLLWLDYDDLLFADHIETLMHAVKTASQTAHEGSPPIIGAYARAWESAGDMSETTILPLTLHTPVSSNGDISAEQLTHDNPLSIQSVLFHRSLFKTIGGFDPDLDTLEDWDLWQRYAQTGRFVVAAKTTSIFFTPHSIIARIVRQYRFRKAEILLRNKAKRQYAAQAE